MKQKSVFTSNILERLQEWYQVECNGDWEHSYGVTIATLDNPGWIVKVDLRETEWENLSLPRRETLRSENDWLQVEISDYQFVGCGGPKNLSEILKEFFDLVSTET